MSWLNAWRTRVRRTLFRRTADAEIDAELRFHLEEEARLRTRAVWVATTFEQIAQDARLGLRILTRSPALAATAVTLVALVVGGNTAIFSLANGVLFKQMPGVRAERLMAVRWIDERGWIEPMIGYGVYRAFAEHSRTLHPLVAIDWADVTLTHQHGTYAVRATLASANYFEALGARVIKGRSFTDEDAERGLPIVIAHHVWQEQFHGADEILGAAIIVNGQPATVVGIAEPRFRGSSMAEQADIWVPLVSDIRRIGRNRLQPNRSEVVVSLIGQRAPGVSFRPHVCSVVRGVCPAGAEGRTDRSDRGAQE